MKKFLVTLLALAHLAMTVSAAVQPHSCIEEPVSEEIGASMTCCEDIQKKVMGSDDKKLTEALVYSSRFLAEEIIPVSADHHPEYVFSLTATPPAAYASPLAGSISLLVLHCTLRI